MTDRKPKKSKSRDDPAWKWLARQLLALVRQFGNTVIWAAVCIYAIYQVGLTLRAFAGKQSVASLLLKVAAHVSLVITVSVAISIGMTGMYLFEHRRHRETRARLTARNIELEGKLDKSRSSSGLSPQGTTQIRDL